MVFFNMDFGTQTKPNGGLAIEIPIGVDDTFPRFPLIT